jgi:hypothetical protein
MTYQSTCLSILRKRKPKEFGKVELIEAPPKRVAVFCPHCRRLLENRKPGKQKCPWCGARIKVEP